MVHQRINILNGRKSQDLPNYYHDDKRRKRPYISWTVQTSIPLPGSRRRPNFWIPNFRQLHRLTLFRYGRKRGSIVIVLCYFALFFIMYGCAKRFFSMKRSWPGSTLVFTKEDIKRIWLWEIDSGHYPSRREIPMQLGFQTKVDNSALPPNTPNITLSMNGVGYRRTYLDIQSRPPDVAYPPRPILGSVADLDIIMEHCDYTLNKYVRDCLEVLRIGAGLDNGRRMRRSLDSDWHYIYVEDRVNSELSSPSAAAAELRKDPRRQHLRSDHDRIINAAASKDLHWENPIELPPPHPRRLAHCDVDDPRIFHMFWTGDFADKPYLSVLSFLFTQNLGLHTSTPVECAPQLWLWINPVPAARLSTPYTANELLDRLRSNKWAAPFFHPRFKDIIYFKLWDTAEQLDTVPELQKEWRKKKTLFNSDGQSIQMHRVQPSQDDETNIQNRAGTKSSDKYDILSVILSDMARFILCHRFGGIYLDADTLFLRDWEELWGWKGAFAYKWSVHEKYNTAVLRLRKQSVLGTFLLRTALKNGLDFHPFSLTTYLKEARMEGLLYRLPDALFDPAWLNMENAQRERPPQPFFTTFGEFFDTPLADSGAPQALGFDGFFKGAFSYHFHNSWWRPVDPYRNFPDIPFASEPLKEENRTVQDDKRDLDWSTVLKRTFESYIRGERPNMYGEWIQW